MQNKWKIWIRRNIEQVDINLLVFLLFFLNVKLVIKIAALCFIYIRRFDLSFTFSRRRNGIPLFYPAMIVIATIDLIIYSLYREQHYTILFLTGIAFWVLCVLAFHQVSLSVNRSPLKKLHNTILVFFVINALASFANLLWIIIETGALNPYRYQGMYQKYFIGTGDYIKGITFDTSTTNAMLNAFGVIYFLVRKQMAMSLLCMIVLLLTFSNFTNLLIIACLLFMFVFRTDRVQKSVIMIQLVLFGLFMANISPQNNEYAADIVAKTFSWNIKKKANTKIIPIAERPDSVLTREERKYKFAQLYLDSIKRIQQLAASRLPISSAKQASADLLTVKPEITKISIHAPINQHRPDSSAERLQAIAFLNQIQKQPDTKIDTQFNKSSLPGKLIAFRQLGMFMKEHPSKLITGDGIGRFSSKLAFRATGLKIAGGYPAKYTFISEDFEKNHLLIYLNYVRKDSGAHSVANYPYSFYAQLLGEYGIAGVGCFILFYAVYFARSFKSLTYGLPILFIVAGALLTEYWFEQLSILILFELLLLLDRREVAETKRDKS